MIHCRKLINIISKRDILKLLEVCYQAAMCHSEEGLIKTTLELDHVFPFEYAFGGYGNPAHNPLEWFNFRDSNEFLIDYFGKGLYLADPVAIEYQTTQKVTNWQEAYERSSMSDEVKRVLQLDLESFGRNDGFAYGIRSPINDFQYFFSFSGQRIENNNRTRLILKYTIPHLSHAMTRITTPVNHLNADNRIILTHRELEVLKWLKEGKGNYEISRILNISERTVNFHANNIREKLNAGNRTHAVAIALEKKLIDW